MQLYCESLFEYQRLKTLEVNIGDLLLGNLHPVRVQTMTTTDTLDTKSTVAQCIRCIEAGAELVRITAPSKKEAENLQNIKIELRKRGFTTPLVADIHFTPNAAEIAARIVEKVRINPGNYIDKKKFEYLEYSDTEYNDEIERIHDRFLPLVKICKEYGTAMRIGTNHGSLSDRIMSRYGDTPMGMVESALEFLRVARDENYHNIVLSMKSSNPIVMVEAYRLLIHQMNDEFHACYPLHLGVTEAGDGEDGRIKSAIGIGTLMEDGIGDTIRVSLTEDPEFEMPVCKDLVNRYSKTRECAASAYPPLHHQTLPVAASLPYTPFSYLRRKTHPVSNVGSSHVPIVVADFSRKRPLVREELAAVGYEYDQTLDKWNIKDAAADYLYCGDQLPEFELPGSLQVICKKDTWLKAQYKDKYLPIFDIREFGTCETKSPYANFLQLDISDQRTVMSFFDLALDQEKLIICVDSSGANAVADSRRFFIGLQQKNIQAPVIIRARSNDSTIDEQLIHFSIHAGGLLVDGFGDGLWLENESSLLVNSQISGRTYLTAENNTQFINNTAFSILQATRARISRTEYISCPSCGRTLFDLQETTANIRAVTGHLKGLKIAIMGCIVNGPGEMADADFGYVGSGPGKITLYRGKEIVKRNVHSEIAVQELVNLLKESGCWTDPEISKTAITI